jgi:Ice-binding-like
VQRVWKVNSAFLKNTDRNFIGTILALTQITLTENITVDGRVLARNADVTFIHDVVNVPVCSTAPGSGPPPPGGTPPPPGGTPPAPGATPPPGGVPPNVRRTPRPRPPVRNFGLTG